MSVSNTLARGDDHSEYRVEVKDDCRIVYGMIPLSDLASILKGMSKKAVMDIELCTRLGATMVAGLPENLEKLRANTPAKSFDSDLTRQIGEGAARWAASGRVGVSSNHLLYTLTGFNAMAWLRGQDPKSKAEVGHPHDAADFRRCRFLLEAEPALRSRLPELSKTHPVWAALVPRWDELCAIMDSESPDWREENPKTRAPLTSAAIRELEGRPARPAMRR